ncbi:putative ATP dependent DEAD-box helicase [Trypanosoma rangeli]|uniref:ATP-dependent RNA helicase n=1 Tax=Trypanosoma rangeli TaxID=5698 RepID=A0A3R7MZ37_TRYRA|nr:putative ATP dependent DEAD-box helicase [Trypanosoma rangeli]RNE97464.1 putative ATP dependent DEAD-box helicase [Trypanosoma rangeli]|eukprot:RNE97464.1 putative ATP dependent DEAD-box helicase [Trypanosoma rangeli]
MRRVPQTSGITYCGGYVPPIHVGIRRVIQSSQSKGLRSVLDQYEDFRLVQQLRKNGQGNYYRYQQRLWSSTEALERSMTERLYSSTERSPLALLPQPKRAGSNRTFILEGHGATALLEATEATLAQNAEETADESVISNTPLNNMEELLAEQLCADYQKGIGSKIITETDLEGTVMESLRERTRHVIEEDLAVNALVSSSSSSLPAAWNSRRKLPSAKDEGGVAWFSLGLDPVLSDRALAKYGPAPTRLQCRLLLALLHEDHNDVLFNGVTGSGKTSGLLLALLQCVRSEAVGLNVFVAKDMLTALHAHSQLRAICGSLGGTVVDRPRDDWSWMYLGAHRDGYETYYRALQRSLQSDHGPVRIFITTADTMCELLFEKKMEFEAFGYLRRVYVDDVGVQIPMLPPSAPVTKVRERLRNPLACELLVGTLHQLPGPHIRSILQLGFVSADMDEHLKDHLKALCVKLERHTIVLSSVCIPSTIHCLFSFYLYHEDAYAYLVKLIWNARSTIPGRAVIFIRYEDDLLQVRAKMRGLGMNVKLFSEVYHDGEFCEKWKFLLLRESEAFGIDIPLVSHVFITFCPRTACSFQHMCGRTGRLGNLGWVYTVTDKRDAKRVREIASQLDVDFSNHVVDVKLTQVDAKDIDRQTKEYELYGLDPQYAVRQHYIVQSENPDMAYRSREFFSKPARRQFQLEDYTPVPVLHRRFINAKKLATDVSRDPSVAVSLQQQNMLDQKLQPTKRLKFFLNKKSGRYGTSFYGGKNNIPGGR